MARKEIEGGGTMGGMAEITTSRGKIPSRIGRKSAEGTRTKSTWREKDTRTRKRRPPKTGRKGQKERQRTGRGAKAKGEVQERYRGTKRKRTPRVLGEKEQQKPSPYSADTSHLRRGEKTGNHGANEKKG